ncbi:cob(I)yrinic acid a,c-diamide adenosyltransferase [Natronoarchaeum philippinense]|uniref:Cob(I)yrinic acid a,c-diamide adenosyltransferase n=1 Tax=Natronoarchaeum philippinense TaxID=558529 RepID=A0A285NT10_NATPI|nr:cob(I)yrinic acid a,c-diamide adenosyltransferase [Natronoarchaeum philippinense]SNZ12589.1 cob(I)yrinic acid a,c-diamide adenosyltransferase [Natronoarchaeum philippinense]
MTDSEPTDDGGADSTEPDRSVGGATPTAEPIEPSEPEEFGLVQVWWGSGKGKTTAAMGMGLRAAGHGYRVHMLQFMKGGAETVEDVRGEYNAIEHVPGFTYENAGHYGWHGFGVARDDAEHETEAEAGLERARELVAGERGDDPVHMLILDEILYAVQQELLDADDVIALIEAKADDLELVLTGGHEEPTELLDRADLVTEVRKQSHPIDAGQGARKGTEF